MASVILGNVAPISKLTIPNTGERVVVEEKHLAQSTTHINIPPHIEFDEAVALVVKHFWPHMSLQPPAWVASDDELMQAVLARQFDCPAGEPDGWEIVVNDGVDRPTYGAPIEAAQAALDSGIGYLEPAPGAEQEAAAPAADETATVTDQAAATTEG